MQHRAGPKKQQGLEQAMVPDMQQTAGQRQPSPRGVAVGGSHHREAQTDEDNANVFHTVIREQPF